MANSSAFLSAGGKRTLVVVVIVLLIVTGLGTTIVSWGTAKAATGAAVPAAVPPAQAACASAGASLPADCGPGIQALRGQFELLCLQLDEAWAKNDWKQAIALLANILAVDPTNSQMRERLYQAHVNLGWALLVQHKFDEANAQFAVALQIKPSGPEALEGQRLLQQLVAPAAVVPASFIATTDTSSTLVSATPQVPVAVAAPQTIAAVCPPVTTATTGSFICYTVKTGDTLFRLAKTFNTTVEAIIAANNLPSCTIFVCQKLLIPVCSSTMVCPAPCPVVATPVCPQPCPTVCAQPCPKVCAPVCPVMGACVYTVQRGDNLFRLALRFKTSVCLLMKVNGLQTTNIRAGQELIIP